MGYNIFFCSYKSLQLITLHSSPETNVIFFLSSGAGETGLLKYRYL